MMILHGRFRPAFFSRALRLLFILSLAPCSGSSVSFAQGSSWRFGAYGDGCLNFVTGGFNNLPGIPKPPAAFGSAVGTGLGGGLFAEIAPGGLFGVGLRAGYQPLSTTQTADETVFIGINGRPTRATIRHTLFSRFTPVGGDATFIIRPLFGQSRKLQIGIGGRLGFFLNSRFEQSQQLIAPPATFVREPDTLRGPVPGIISPQFSAIARLGWAISLNRKGSIVMMPEASFQYALTNLAGGVGWKASTFTAGIALGFGGGAEDVIRRDTLYRRDTVTSFSVASGNDQVVLLRRDLADQTAESPGTRIITTTITESYRHDVPRPAPVLAGSLRVRFALPNGADTSEISLQIRESLIRRFVALPWTIGAVQNVATLPASVRALSAAEAKTFTIDGLNGAGAEAIYQQQLNILAKRAREHPGAAITILTAAGDSTTAAADAVRDYLRDVWRIEPSRLKVERGRGDHRGVLDLAVSEPALLAPVEVIDTLKRAILPGIRFYPVVTSEAGIRSWMITIDQGDREGVASLSGKDDPPEAIRWETASEPDVRDPSTYPLRYRFTLEDQAGQRVNVATGSILFEKTKFRNASGDIGRVEYSLPADESYLREHPELIREIHAAIVPGARVSVNVYGESGDGEVKGLAGRIAHDLDIPSDRIEDIPAGVAGRNIPDAEMLQKRIVISIIEEIEPK